MDLTRAETGTVWEDLAAVTSSIVVAYVQSNAVPAVGLAPLIASVHASVAELATQPAAATVRRPDKPNPAVPIHKSVTDDAIVCLECGRRMKTLKIHLRTVHGKTPADYRAAWNLPVDYPLIAPSFAEARSQLAKQLGLGALQHQRPKHGSRDAKGPTEGRARRRSDAYASK